MESTTGFTFAARCYGPMSGYGSYGRATKRARMPRGDAITVTISDVACTIALLPSFGPTPMGFTASRYDHIVRKINLGPVDSSLGMSRAVRHMVLSLEDARELGTAFRESAEAYRLADRTVRRGGRWDRAGPARGTPEPVNSPTVLYVENDDNDILLMRRAWTKPRSVNTPRPSRMAKKPCATCRARGPT